MQPYPSVYPVLILPSEITSEIFIQCLPSGPLEEESEDPHPSQAPLLLLQICRTWRNIALSTPALWVVLRLDAQKMQWLGSFPTEDWFKRAGGMPLSLTLHGWDLSFPAIIERYACRLRCLDVAMYTGDFSRLPDTAAFPLLQKLTFMYGGAITMGEVLVPRSSVLDMIPFQALQHAPQLREVNFPHSSIFLRSGFLPWGQLTSFTSAGVYAWNFVRVLRWAPLLVHCTVQAAESVADGEIEIRDEDIITHPHLEFLTLRGRCAHFLEFITLPALQYLCLDNYGDINHYTFIQFLSRSTNPLRKFSCQNSYFPYDRVSVEAIRAMPKLTHLELGTVDGRYKDDLFRMLDREEQPDALPNLQSITITEFLGGVNEDLVQALFSRSVANEKLAKLQSFSVLTISYDPFDRRPGSAQLPRLSRLVAEEGMKIQFGTQTENFMTIPFANISAAKSTDGSSSEMSSSDGSYESYESLT